MYATTCTLGQHSTNEVLGPLYPAAMGRKTLLSVFTSTTVGYLPESQVSAVVMVKE